ncbi:hypothetical protein ACLOJK_041231 [Asimina triloba]
MIQAVPSPRHLLLPRLRCEPVLPRRLHRMPLVPTMPLACLSRQRLSHPRPPLPWPSLAIIDRPHRCLIEVGIVDNNVARLQRTTTTTDVCIEDATFATMPTACYSVRKKCL